MRVAAGDHRIRGTGSDLRRAGFLLTGQPVFPRTTTIEICASHIHSPVVPPSRVAPGVPGELEAIVLACLEKDPQCRPASAGELATSLESLKDIPAWTSADAHAWWAKPGVAARASDRSPESTAKRVVLAVDLGARADA